MRRRFCGLMIAAATVAGCRAPAQHTASRPAVASRSTAGDALVAPYRFTPEAVLFGADDPPAPPAVVAPAAARRDLALLVYALRTAYGGQRFLDGALVAAAEERLARLTPAAPVAPAALCHAIGDALATLPDRHLEARLVEARCGHQAVPPPGGVGPNVAPPYPGAAALPWRIETRIAGAATVGLIAITRLPPAKDPVWDRFLDGLDVLRSTQALVIDLRGNSGGEDTTLYRLAQALSGRFVRRSGVAKVRSQRPGTWALRMNGVALDLMARARRGQARPAHLEEQLAALAAMYQRARRGELAPEVVEAPGPAAPLPRRFAPYERSIFVLVDRRCGSSCETGLDVLDELPNVIVVGERTAGVVHFGNVGKLVLPGTAIVVQLATQYTSYADGTFIEGTGFPPDLAVAPGADALAAALARIAAERPASPSLDEAARIDDAGPVPRPR